MQSDNDKTGITVVYLCWLPYGIDYFRRFISSYLLHDAGCQHHLLMVFNGTELPHPDPPADYLALFSQHQLPVPDCVYFDQGQDIEVYKKVAGIVTTEYIFYLNTYSEILASNWLKCYRDHFTTGVGAISASASCQSYFSSVFQQNPLRWEFSKGWRYNYRKYKLMLKAFFYWHFLFKPFPNPHLRTNAFMLRSRDFLNMPTPVKMSKFDAYQFESGRKSMTNYFIRKGLRVLVVDKSGNCYEKPDWKKSSTFRINEQQQLLIADNQTGIYQEADAAERAIMTKLAWGTDE